MLVILALKPFYVCFLHLISIFAFTVVVIEVPSPYDEEKEKDKKPTHRVSKEFKYCILNNKPIIFYFNSSNILY